MKVSIITVSYNSVETIGETIQSVIRQSYKNLEYLIIDGDSSDGTQQVLSRYADKIDVLVSEPDRGIYEAMNKGLERASGDVVGFINSDDLYADDRVIETVVATMERSGCACCYGDLDYVARDNPASVRRRWKSRSYEAGLFKKGWQPPHPTFFVRRALYRKHGGFSTNYSISADYELMLRFLHRYQLTAEYIPDVLVKMRVGGVSNQSLRKIIKANIECWQAWHANGLHVSPLIMLRKPASKLFQYFFRAKTQSGIPCRIVL